MTAIPRKIGKYEVLGIAGKGAMGQVFIGHDPFVDRKVAIKVCTTAGTQSAIQARKMFLNEAQAAGALDHPNILRIYDADEVNGQLFIVMEYVEGGNNLKRHCKPHTLLPVETVIEYIAQCGQGLDYAHSKNVLHRDIKPENILLTSEGQVKIADFGIAQRLKLDATVARGVFGSPLYMSPEQLDGSNLTGHTDLYSLGVSLYELFAGRPPFLADTVTQLLAKIATEEPPPISNYRPDLPDNVATVVMKAIQKPPQARFQSGIEFAEALRGARQSHWGDKHDLSDDELCAMARDLSFFNEFSDAELEQVLEVGSWRRFSAFEKIFQEGSREQHVFVLATGEATVKVGDKPVAVLSAGDCVGEIAFLSGEPRSATVIADKEVWALQVDDPPSEWASMSVQLSFRRAFERTFISRLKSTSQALASVQH